ncbi:MAG TPA: dihydrodipicolinate reductase C-terminal domain-containing protein [Thermoanaerobaculia bacterium]|jgi:4-hydroxy-tetrahydrodipicolinate reductase|nr:dihydrodipicolinate reductase C-terminal domain-containing protein [Thermoanaerobaculia bacterium]
MNDPTTRIALLGYGRMGRLIEEIAPSERCSIGLRLDREGNRQGQGITAEAFAEIDVAIDFSVSSSVIENVERIAALGIPLVVGTTGWGGDLPRVREIVERTGIGFVHGANFSIGIQVFYQVVAEAARRLAAAEGYDAWAHEIHHRKKRDAPSGTLLETVRTMERAGFSRPIDVASNRAGAIPGTHTIGFDSDADTILIEHRARSRAGFARGALSAARWVVARRGFFDFRDVWSEVLSPPP